MDWQVTQCVQPGIATRRAVGIGVSHSSQNMKECAGMAVFFTFRAASARSMRSCTRSFAKSMSSATVRPPSCLVDVLGAIEHPQQSLDSAKYLQANLGQFLITHNAIANALGPGVGQVSHVPEVRGNTGSQGLRHVAGIGFS